VSFDKYNSLEFKMAELHDAIKDLRKNPEVDEVCFKVYSQYDDISLHRSSLEEEAKKYGYNIYFKPGPVGTTLGMLKDVTSEYWN
jgi:hypothetical protein